jgi:hypothetical protein
LIELAVFPVRGNDGNTGEKPRSHGMRCAICSKPDAPDFADAVERMAEAVDALQLAVGFEGDEALRVAGEAGGAGRGRRHGGEPRRGRIVGPGARLGGAVAGHDRFLELPKFSVLVAGQQRAGLSLQGSAAPIVSIDPNAKRIGLKI